MHLHCPKPNLGPVEKYFPIEAKKRMDELVQYLIDAYKDSIENLSWMSDETKVKALEKLEKKIGNPIRIVLKP